MIIYQAVAADGVTGTGMTVAITPSTGAQVGTSRYPLEPRRAQLAGEAGVPGWTPVRDVS